jgi:hypothetical protein
MERRRKTGPRATISRLDPTDYDASPFAISMYPNLDTFTEHGQIVIGYIEPAGEVWPWSGVPLRRSPYFTGEQARPSSNSSPASILPSPVQPSMTSTSTK